MRETARAATVPAGGLPLSRHAYSEAAWQAQAVRQPLLGRKSTPLPFYSTGANPERMDAGPRSGETTPAATPRCAT